MFSADAVNDRRVVGARLSPPGGGRGERLRCQLEWLACFCGGRFVRCGLWEKSCSKRTWLIRSRIVSARSQHRQRDHHPTSYPERTRRDFVKIPRCTAFPVPTGHTRARQRCCADTPSGRPRHSATPLARGLIINNTQFDTIAYFSKRASYPDSSIITYTVSNNSPSPRPPNITTKCSPQEEQ